MATHILQKAFYPIHSKVKVYFLLFKTFRTIIQMRMVTTISGSVFPTGISILIKIRYSTNPITQITAFRHVNRFAQLSARFSRKKSAIWMAIIGANTEPMRYRKSVILSIGYTIAAIVPMTVTAHCRIFSIHLENTDSDEIPAE